MSSGSLALLLISAWLIGALIRQPKTAD